jgi:vancomycin resistance protein YoaR
MIKSIRSLNIFLLALILSIGVIAVALYLYGTQSKLPSGFTVSGWQAGRINLEQFQNQLQQKLDTTKQQKINLYSSASGVPSQEMTLGQLGIQWDEAELIAKLKPVFEGSIRQRILSRWQLRSIDLELNPQFDTQILTAAVEQAWSKLYEMKPMDAKRIISETDEVSYETEKQVSRIDILGLQKQLETLVPPFSSLMADSPPLQTALPLYELKPAVLVEALRKQGIERKIYEFTTSFPTNVEGRIHNIRSTAASIHDLLLGPGEVFDYSKIIQHTEAHFGYKEAPVILNGKLVPGIGGGICQVSTTLYNAVLRTGLEIVERRNHSLPISYAPLGQDATYSTGYINFKFRNTTGAHLLIRTTTTDRQVTVKLFGTLPSTLSYDIESKVIDTLEPPVKYVHNPTLRRGKQEKLSSGKPGYVVETYRYKKENGTVVDQELVSKDRYSPQPILIAINSGEALPEGQELTPQMLEDGIKGPTFR